MIFLQAASVFVLYATSSANAAAQKCSRKTITGGDVINAMGDMEFEKVLQHSFIIICMLKLTCLQFVRPLENSLAIWKKSQKDKKDSAAAKKKATSEIAKDANEDANDNSEKVDDDKSEEANNAGDSGDNKENAAE